MRLFVTGTDTGVGKTRVTAALARALVARGERPTIVKLVQTGLAPGEPGDAHVAASLAGCEAQECARFALPADPWSAALAAGEPTLDAAALVARLDAFAEPLVVEGSGGIAVPLNARETLADVAAAARCEAIVVVGLRLGCINHARLTCDHLATHGIAVRALVYVACWETTSDAYRADVARALHGRAPHVASLPFEADAARGVAAAARLLADIVATRASSEVR